MLPSKLTTVLDKTVSQNFDQQIHFLSNLVSAPSTNPYTADTSSAENPIEQAVAKVIELELKESNIPVKRVGINRKRFNLVSQLGPARHRRSLMLNGHMDTVALSEEGIETAFVPRTTEKRMYGAGVLDMKASLSAYIYAVKALLRNNVSLAGKLFLSFVVDELPGACSEWGTHYVLEQGYVPKSAIIAEPGINVIAIGHRGGYRFKLKVFGESVHTGILSWERKRHGKNALVEMSKAILALEDLEIEYKPSRLFNKRKPVFTFPTLLEGGTAINTVPESCIGYGDVRLMPGNTDSQIRQMIVERLDKVKNLKYELTDILFVPAMETEAREEVVRSLERQAKQILTHKPEVRGVGPWSDGWMFMKRDIPTVSGFGPEGGNLHQANEWVDLASLKQLTKVYARTIVDYLGVKKD